MRLDLVTISPPTPQTRIVFDLVRARVWGGPAQASAAPVAGAHAADCKKGSRVYTRQGRSGKDMVAARSGRFTYLFLCAVSSPGLGLRPHSPPRDTKKPTYTISKLKSLECQLVNACTSPSKILPYDFYKQNKLTNGKTLQICNLAIKSKEKFQNFASKSKPAG